MKRKRFWFAVRKMLISTIAHILIDLKSVNWIECCCIFILYGRQQRCSRNIDRMCVQKRDIPILLLINTQSAHLVLCNDAQFFFFCLQWTRPIYPHTYNEYPFVVCYKTSVAVMNTMYKWRSQTYYRLQSLYQHPWLLHANPSSERKECNEKRININFVFGEIIKSASSFYFISLIPLCSYVCLSSFAHTL